jgi:hypothetical protein
MIYYKVPFETTNYLRHCIERLFVYDSARTRSFAAPALIYLPFGTLYLSLKR